MTTMTPARAGTSTRRLLAHPTTQYADHLAAWGPLPTLDAAALVDLAEECGLTGRGGAGFPTAVKVRAVLAHRRRPVVVGNAMEGEPVSHKDALLMARVPHLVLDGLDLVRFALGAKRAIVATGPEVDSTAAISGVRARRAGIEVRPLVGGFVAGQESALVSQLNGGPATPRDSLPRVTQTGVDRRPTLVVNVETLAHLALAARFGPAWFRSVGRADDPGTSLFSITGAVRRPGVVEAPRGSSLRAVLAGAEPVEPAAVLVGGYHGAWIPTEALDTPLTRGALAPFGASVGAGVLHVIGSAACPLVVTSRIVDYLAGESARQCGPCLNGLPHLAETLRRVTDGSPDPRLPAELDRLRAVVTGRGACAHPDGTARLVASTVRVFGEHITAHRHGRCPTTGRAAPTLAGGGS